MSFNTCLNNIQEKFNYDEEMMDLVELSFKALLCYYSKYGDYSNKIYNLFMTTRIIPYNTGIDNHEEKEFLLRKYSDKTEENIKNRHIGEVGELLHKIKGDEVIKTIIIKRTEGKIRLETLVHELIHGLVTSEKTIKKEHYEYIQSGLSRDYIKPLEYTKNHYIEEGLTEYDAIMACRSIGYMAETSDNYKHLYDYAETIMEDINLNKIITKTRLDGIDYIDQIKDQEYKDTLNVYINRLEDACHRESIQERNRIIEFNKNDIQKILKKKAN